MAIRARSRFILGSDFGILLTFVIRVLSFRFRHYYVGLTKISSTTALGGRLIASSAQAATSSGRIILARAAALGGAGRRSSNGVSMSPGKIAHARMPLA